MKSIIWATTLAAFVSILILGSWFTLAPHLSDRGHTALSALFTGFAFSGVIFTAWLQATAIQQNYLAQKATETALLEAQFSTSVSNLSTTLDSLIERTDRYVREMQKRQMEIYSAIKAAENKSSTIKEYESELESLGRQIPKELDTAIHWQKFQEELIDHQVKVYVAARDKMLIK